MLTQPVEVIVNSWNRNLIPWWLLLPQGVSGEIKRQAGFQPFWEVSRAGSMPLGTAVLTSAGRLPYRGIIHVAGINLLWRASEKSVRQSVCSALALVEQHRFRSLAFPLIGAGTGGLRPERVECWMLDEFSRSVFSGVVLLVRYDQSLS
ncbi:macro domain-containing protein [Deinococcus alpinitundrae]|uniref:macro domain-containing protein n=1 Tax=Deinococcus alpinitundrae TaxID=468913 RepID=UPI001ED92CFD|nr:macro domain-containing protein [Deinococcus alpinitundrae]